MKVVFKKIEEITTVAPGLTMFFFSWNYVLPAMLFFSAGYAGINQGKWVMFLWLLMAIFVYSTRMEV